MTGLERLKSLSKDSKNPSLLKVIDYLETRKDMYEKYLNEEKTPDQMWQYIREKAMELQVDNCAFLDDKVVYAWAISYFLFSNEYLGIRKNNTKIETTKKAKNNVTKIEDAKAKKETKSSDQISLFGGDT